jgi:hypothetical protein
LHPDSVTRRADREVEQTRSVAQPRYVVIYGAACSYCLSIAKKLEGSYLRTFAPQLREQLAQTLAVFVMSILTQPRGGLNTEGATKPRLCQIIEELQRVMCTHETEKLAISVLGIYEDRKCEERGDCNADTTKENSLACGISAS